MWGRWLVRIYITDLSRITEMNVANLLDRLITMPK
jgi:hypothetical protein